MYRDLSKSYIVVLIIFPVLFFVLLLTVVARYRQRVLENTTLKNRLDKELLQSKLEIQEQTLTSISQEIHDNIGQVLSLIKLNLSAVKSIEENAFQESKTLLTKAITDLRNISRSMQGSRITEIGLQKAISEELISLQNSGLFNTQLHIIGQPFSLNHQKEIILFRVAQEALNNIIKHAQAKTVIVDFDYGSQSFKLTISDDGIGKQQTVTEQISGIGLSNMANRTKLIEGNFAFEPGKNGLGSVVRIELPIESI